jgi:GAF domain-containing protein
MDGVSSATALGVDLVEAFAETARSLYASDLDTTLDRVTETAVGLIGGCKAASVSVSTHTGISTRAATDPMARAADEIQCRLGQGPSLDAATTTRLVYTPDTAQDKRWPQFGSRVAAEVGICSIVSCRLSILTDRERIIGCLNLYGTAPNAFSEEDVGIALLLGVHAGAVVAAALDHNHLREAIEGRDVIGQAKGILMERLKVTPEQAFDQLRMMSQRLNVKVRQLAQRLAETGEVP